MGSIRKLFLPQARRLQGRNSEGSLKALYGTAGIRALVVLRHFFFRALHKPCPLKAGTSGDARAYISDWRCLENCVAMGKEYRDPSLRRAIRKPNRPATLRMTVGWVGDIWNGYGSVTADGFVNVKSTRTRASAPHGSLQRIPCSLGFARDFGTRLRGRTNAQLRLHRANRAAPLRMTAGWVGDIWDASELVAGNGVVNVKSTRTGVSVPHEPSRFLASSRRVSDKGLRRFCAGTIKPAGEAPPPHHHTTSSIAGLTRGSD